MNEETLAQIKAEAMTVDQLRREIARIDYGITVAASPRVLPSYRRRKAIYEAELARRPGAAPSGRLLAAAVALPFVAAPVFFLLTAAAFPVAQAALTREHAAQYRTNWICPRGLGCTNADHLNLLRRTNSVDNGAPVQGAVGIRAR